MKDGHKLLLKYSITFAAAGLFTLFIMWLRGFDSAPSLQEQYRILADSFSIPGLLLVLFTALFWVSSEGAFDGLGYAFSRIGSMFIPFHKKSLEHKTYYDYKMEKKDKRAHGYSFLFFVGLFYLAVSIVFIILFESVYVPMV